MTTTEEHLNRTRHAVAADDRDERARRAVIAFRAMQHGLTSYARAITKNKHVRVELAAGVPRTDGKKIYYQPPIALGDKTPHERRDCDKRGESGLQKCPACAVREEVLINIYHEIGHIAGGTFAEVPDHVKKNATQKAIDEWGGKYAEQIKRRFEAAPGRITGTYKGLAGLISPYLPYLVNCIEDARVDAAMFKARKGIRTMMEASTISIFTEGCEQADGTMKQWKDNPLNAQASIACYLAACGYKGWQDWLHPQVAEAFADEKIRVLLASVADMHSAQQTYEVSFPVLARLRELGFFQMPEDKEEEKDEQDEDAGNGDESGEESSESGDSSEAGEDSSQDAGSDSGEGEPSDQAGDRGDSDCDDEVGSPEGSGGDGSADDEDGEESDGSDGADGDDEEAGNDSQEGDEVDGDSQEDASSTSESETGSTSDSDELSDGTDASDSGLSSENDSSSEPVERDSDEHDDSTDPVSESEDGGSDQEESGSDGDSDSGGPDSEESGVATSSYADYSNEDGDKDSDEEAGEDSDSDAGEPTDESSERDSSGDQQEELSDPDRIDTGADEGEGGVELEDIPPHGEPEDLEGIVEHFHRDDVEVEQSAEEEAAVQIAIVQGLYFEKPSENVVGVREHKFDHPMTNDQGTRLDQAWAHDRMLRFYRQHFNADDKKVRYQIGIDAELDVSEEIMGPALLQTRRVFTDNETAKHQRNLRSGRVNKAVLGRRGWNDDDRLFSKKRLPGKRSYAVLIGIDVSGSTVGENLALAKRAAWAQAELCARAGINFAMYAHSANKANGDEFSEGELYLDIYELKAFNEPWDSNRQHRLAELGSDSQNLDGHSIEYYRKRLDEVEATDKILLYYTDGKMPAANYDEELEILQREIKTCKNKGYALLGVGIRTDSPRRHGLDTVQVDGDEDLKAVVMHLEKRLVRAR